MTMKLYFKRSMSDWGFNLSQMRWSISVCWKFAIGWTVFWTIGIIDMTFSSGQPLSVISHQLTSRNIIGNLSVMLLMPGSSEEALFRGFAVVVLAQAWKGSLQFGKVAGRQHLFEGTRLAKPSVREKGQSIFICELASYRFHRIQLRFTCVQ